MWLSNCVRVKVFEYGSALCITYPNTRVGIHYIQETSSEVRRKSFIYSKIY